MLSQQIISESCSWFHTQQNSGKALAMQAFSGIGINRLGSYQQCSNDPTFRYFLIQYSLYNTRGLFYTGVCYSSNCTSNDLVYIAKSVNQYIPLPFQQFKIFEPSAVPDFWNTYTIVIMSVILSLVLVNLSAVILRICKPKFNQQNRNNKIMKIVQFLSVKQSLSFFFRKSYNNQRLNVLVGLRALAFLCMTLHNLIYLVLETPSLPKPTIAKLHNINLFFFNDVWLIISGFYYSFELCKFWSKAQSYKYIFNAFIRKVIKIIIFIIISIVLSFSVFKSISKGPLWTLTMQYIKQQCNIFNLFAKCNYWLWIWLIEIQTSLLCSLLFILWNLKLKYHKALYIVIHVLFITSSMIISVFYGNRDQDNYSYQGSIIKCPMVSGMSYLIGFNIGLFYYYFRISKYKFKYHLIRILKYKTNRIITSIISLSVLTLISLHQLFFIYTQPEKVSQLIYQLFRIVFPISLLLLIMPEMLGFENIWGTLFKDRFMNIASKLSFSSYTLYMMVAVTIVNELKEDLYINLAKIVTLWMCSVVGSMVFGFMLSILIQMPVYRLLNHLFGKNKLKAYIQFY